MAEFKWHPRGTVNFFPPACRVMFSGVSESLFKQRYPGLQELWRSESQSSANRKYSTFVSRANHSANPVPKPWALINSATALTRLLPTLVLPGSEYPDRSTPRVFAAHSLLTVRMPTHHIYGGHLTFAKGYCICPDPIEFFTAWRTAVSSHFSNVQVNSYGS